MYPAPLSHSALLSRLQACTEVVGLTQVLRRTRHARRAAAIPEHAAQVVHAEVAAERLVVRLKRIEGPIVRVPCHGEEDRT